MATITWIDKYKPKKISELTTNIQAVKTIQSWLTNYNNKTINKEKIIQTDNSDDQIEDQEKKVKKKNSMNKSCMIISGNHGIGKTVTLNVILYELGYNVIDLDINILKNSTNIEDTVKKLLKQRNILKLLDDNLKNKYAIVVDELEGISGSAEKTSLIALQRLNDQNWYCPVVFISNNQHNKFVSDIKKASIEVKMWPPFDSEMEKILLKISKAEGLQIKHKSVANKIIKHSQSDIRRLIYTLEDIKNAYGNNIILPEIIDEYCLMSSKKDIDIDLYKATNELIYEYNSVDDCLRLFETEKVLLPLMIQQNYISSILENNKQEKKKQNITTKISDLLSTGDVIENYIYGDQNWEMEDIHGFYTCAATSYYLAESFGKTPIKPKLLFATDLNKTSIKRINKKNIINVDKCFTNMNIDDYLYLSKLVKHFISNNDITECVKLLNKFNIKLEHIESLLKIDKIENIKSSLTAKQKTEFSNQLNSKK
ncbi:replication factor C large subunit [Indivirus ILV1]|uniref:Replication factor C large subunit n=1 Tax=Indivirus ILV1 TaxID=1977633 RepID=A0A1V0SDX9_9VIRU|nr:replication factor C large subunit [Indivirus ILV1]